MSDDTRGGYGRMEQVQETIQRIDGQLDALVDISGQQKHIASNMGHELDAQNRMISGMSLHMDSTQEGVDKANRAVLRVKQSAGTCTAWIIAIVLIIIIVVLPFVWK
jgi:t-SNARE complex subunit (syntaxin)